MATPNKVVLWPLFSPGLLCTLDGAAHGWGADYEEVLCPNGGGWGEGDYTCYDLTDVGSGNGLGCGRVNRGSYNGNGYGYGEGDQLGGGSVHW